MRPRTTTIFGLLCLTTSWIGPVAAGDRPPVVEHRRVADELPRLLEELDDDRFDVRRRAAERLEALVVQPELGPLLAGEFERVLISPEVSFEVRSLLERLRPRLPQVAPEPVGNVSPEEIDRLVRCLDDPSYGVRVGANRRLERLLEDHKTAGPIMARLMGRMDQGDQTVDSRRWVEPLYRRARGALLLSDTSDWALPEVPEGRIAQRISELLSPAPAGVPADAWHVHELAQWELLDLLARREYSPRVKRALQVGLDRHDLDLDAACRLEKLVDLTRPAMVAEYWHDRRHLSEQHLLVGVPSMSAGARRPSHFDRVDDRVAHCVSGNSLSPGDHPVGVAIPHPLEERAFFHLVNLPTPRRRMAYTYYVETDEAARLIAISRRTLQSLLARKQPLSEAELVLLAQLDPGEVSRFAGEYFALVEDGRLPAEGPIRAGGRPSRHGMICAQLAADGTNRAIAGLLEAIRHDRFLPPNSLAPYRLQWIAALSIANRDPWPQTDAWLVGLLERTETLEQGPAYAPQLGATAAGILLERRGQGLSQFGLDPAGDTLLEKYGLRGYRFRSPKAREDVQSWWACEAGTDTHEGSPSNDES